MRSGGNENDRKGAPDVVAARRTRIVVAALLAFAGLASCKKPGAAAAPAGVDLALDDR
jgi:hypothetical protein